PRIRNLVAAAAVATVAASDSAAGAAVFNTCTGARAERLRCPDLTMRRPFDLYLERSGGRLRLHAGNAIVNRGRGPLEVARRRRGSSMRVTQHIYDYRGSMLNLPSPRARIVFKNIPGGPGAGRYWKFKDAAA